jgi:hypothetical protein
VRHHPGVARALPAPSALVELDLVGGCGARDLGRVHPGGEALHRGEAGHEVLALGLDERQPDRGAVGERAVPGRQRHPEPGRGELGEQAGQLAQVRRYGGQDPLDRLARGVAAVS